MQRKAREDRYYESLRKSALSLVSKSTFVKEELLGLKSP